MMRPMRLWLSGDRSQLPPYRLSLQDGEELMATGCWQFPSHVREQAANAFWRAYNPTDATAAINAAERTIADWQNNESAWDRLICWGAG